MKIMQLMPDFNLAGAQTMCENLSMELKKNNDIDLVVVSFYSNKTAITKRMEDAGIRIVYLEKKKGLDLGLFSRLRKTVELERPDIIHSHRYALQYLIPAMKFSSYKDYRIVHTIHNMAREDVTKLLFPLQKKWFAKKLAQPVAISKKVKDSICKEYELPKEEIPIVYNGIILSRCIKKQQYALRNKVVHIGRFQPAKNQMGIVEIFRMVHSEVPDAKLIFIGDGPQLEEVKARVKELYMQDVIEFKGKVDNVYKDLNMSDVFILLSSVEGMPMTLIEAMGTGLPCVAYPVGGIPEMIENNKSGLLAQTNVDAANRIIELLKKEDLRESIGKAALEKSKDFSATQMAKNYTKLYLQTMAKKK